MKFFLKVDRPVEFLNLLKKDPCVPISALIPAFPDRHDCGLLPEETFPWRPSEVSKYRYTLVEVALNSAFSLRFT